MYFHGLEDVGTQVSRVATSRNGIEFEAQPEILGPSYMRIFSHDARSRREPWKTTTSLRGLPRFHLRPIADRY